MGISIIDEDECIIITNLETDDGQPIDVKRMFPELLNIDCDSTENE